MPAARAVKGLVAGVVEAAFAGVDLGLTIRLGASGRMPDCDPLGIGSEPALHSCGLLASSPASALAAGRAAFCFNYRATFPRGPLTEFGGPCADFCRCASEAGGRPCQSEAARQGWRGVLAQRTPPIRWGGAVGLRSRARAWRERCALRRSYYPV